MPQTHNVIGIVYDFDKTLSPHSMQEDTIFPRLDINAAMFWSEVEKLTTERYYESELAWMRLLLENKEFRAISNTGLKEMGNQLQFYPGVPDFFSELTNIVQAPEYQKHGISVEHYIITSGLKEVIEGSAVRPFVKAIYGSEFDEDANNEISFPKRAVGHTQKTQYLFRINKGYLDLGSDINDHMPKEERRIPFPNMIYIGDGPTDVPCFSVMSESGGRTLAVYDPNNPNSFTIGMQLRKAHRVEELAEADFREGSHLRRILDFMVQEIAARICQDHDELHESKVISAPRFT
ncbi:haloacid dehalogenase-like hydrolase [SAR202 cluster bacterium AD-802-E10_MRT_200m]|nr:haloacid dehalogenase-like hydrolase [SAR202 cluster bacterium AD-802-E10_MRT_200m]